jgi:DNA-binding transcriptional regulator GbsR (MarR family)
MIAYLDLNVFDRIEKLFKLDSIECNIYQPIQNAIEHHNIIVPYSNAHLNDLYRWYCKDQSFTDGHLENIKQLTNNLCICQYWNQKNAVFHYRDVNEFFKEKVNDYETEISTFEEIFDLDPELLNFIKHSKLFPLPNTWRKLYQQDPIFGIIYPKTKIENNFYALMEDIFNFQYRLKTDYSLYKTFRTKLLNSLNQLKGNQVIITTTKTYFKNLPKHLDVFDISELLEIKSNSINNQNYFRIIDTFYKFDLKGYKSDGSFNNMFDDSLHTFYAAHCDIFITNDDRCKYKAEKTYERLGIKTKVIKANEFESIKNCL